MTGKANRLNVLVAGDEQFSAQALKIQLDRAGYEVILVSDGKEAWTNLQYEDNPKVVFSIG